MMSKTRDNGVSIFALFVCDAFIVEHNLLKIEFFNQTAFRNSKVIVLKLETPASLVYVTPAPF